MQIYQGVQGEFIKRFTKELILNVKFKLDKERLKELEEQRLKSVIEAEKLKQKFSEFLQKKPIPPQINKPKIIVQKPQQIIPPVPVIPAKQIKVVPLENQNQEDFQLSIVSKNKEPAKEIIIPQEPKEIIQQPIKKPIPPQINKPQIIVQKPQQIIPQNQLRTIPQEEIDFGKITPLVKDPLITYIESPGENKNVIIRKMGSITKTQIILNKSEIIQIIISFSEKARIPLIEGMLNARVNNLEISAVTSEVLSPSFIIKKNPIPDMNPKPTQLMKPPLANYNKK